MSTNYFKTLESALGKRYSLTCCFVLDKTFIVFIAFKSHSDGWNIQLKLLVYLPKINEKEDENKWYATKLNGVFGRPWFGGVLSSDNQNLILIGNTGTVHKVGGSGIHPQPPIPNSQIALERTSHALYFLNAKVICDKLYTVNNQRKVFQFDSEKWRQLKEGIDDFGRKLDKSYGFDDIGGFAEDDIYAAGGKADLWHWNGQKWTQKELPTNAELEMICCGEDGLVYIPTNRNTILCGRDNNWEVIKDNIPETYFESIVWYKDRVYVSTSYMLCQIQDKKVTRVDDFPFYASGSLAVGDGIMVAALGNEVAVYDGETWTDISKGEKLPWEEK